MASEIDPEKVIVIGAGPVGALAALYAATRGDHVEIYELRGDLRDASTVPLNFTKSINLALSERGINAMRHAGQDDLIKSVLGETIPMYGRMVHGEKNGKLFEKPQTYDVRGNAIHAVDRGGLNKRLLDALEAMPNVTFFFNHKLTGADFKRRKAWFERKLPASTTQNPDLTESERAPEIEVDFDLLIGADGAHSAARFHLMKFARVSYQQEYIDTLWCEFHIPPDFASATSDSTFALSPRHLHIWPGTRFMFIAIPSLDHSFTCTLFAPQSTFEDLSHDPETLLPPFFTTNFPGVSPNLISTMNLVAQFTSNPHLPLISIKCTPYHFSSSAVILGDAAHAMVPFYGQGMNAGLEDVRVLFSCLDSEGVYTITGSARSSARANALSAYTTHRAPDASAINDLALRNYLEMRSGVVSPIYLVRKFVEETLSLYLPALGWRTQYSRVSFSNERYSEVIAAVRQQGVALLVGLVFMGCVAGGSMGWVIRRRLRGGGGMNWIRGWVKGVLRQIGERRGRGR